MARATSVGVCMIILCLCSVKSMSATLTVTDPDMLPARWNALVYRGSNPAETGITLNRDLVVNSQALRVDIGLSNPVASFTFDAAIYNNQTAWNADTMGAIASVQYQACYLINSNVEFAPLLFQNGTIYVPNRHQEPPNFGVRQCLADTFSINDFVRQSGPGGAQPNFGPGAAPIYFGLNNRRGTFQGRTNYRIADFQLTATMASGPDSASLSVVPSGGTLAVGNRVTVANAVAGTIGRQNGRINSVNVSNRFTLAGLAGNTDIPPGSQLTGTVGFDDSGLLNNAVVPGTISMNLSGPAGSTGVGTYSFNVQGIASENLGGGTATVVSGASYAGLNAVNGSGNRTVARLLAGTNATGGTTTVGMQFGNSSSSFVASDVVDLNGTDGDLFVLQLTYNPELIGANEASLAAAGNIYLSTLVDGVWQNAIAANQGANLGLGNVQGPWTGQMELGAWGIDAQSNTVWSVLDHNTSFAVTQIVPEPSSGVLLGCVTLLCFRRRPRTTSASIHRGITRTTKTFKW